MVVRLLPMIAAGDERVVLKQKKRKKTERKEIARAKLIKRDSKGENRTWLERRSEVVRKEVAEEVKLKGRQLRGG